MHCPKPFRNLYSYLENQEEVQRANVPMIQKWTQNFKLTESCIIYSKPFNAQGELRVFCPC